MGGDHAPQIVVEGAALALEKHPGAKFLIFGDEAELAPLVKKFPALEGRAEIRHTPDRVLSDDKPAAALRAGRNSSMRLAIDAVADAEADCVVSAGNTGALMAMAKFALKVMPGIHRPAIATYLPTKIPGHGTVFMDMGANAECTPENLLQFAVLGGVFSREVFKTAAPRIGLLNIGSEAMKGNDLVRLTSERLAAATLPGAYVGYAEGDDIMTGDFDVVVTDGFTGNVTLKAIEGTAKIIKHMMKEAVNSSWLVKLGAVLMLPGVLGLLICYRAFKTFFKRMDPRHYNGACLLGLRGLCIKSHGGTDAVGFANAIGVAAGLAVSKFNEKVEAQLQQLGQEGGEASPARLNGGAPAPQTEGAA
jgi:glycerol-3-phosphate acyltransferase PlsX